MLYQYLQPHFDFVSECTTCKRMDSEATFPAAFCRLSEDLETYIRKEESTFLKHVNAFMNTEGGGFIVIHVNEPHLLDEFDNIVSKHMRKLIVDCRQFSEQFERSFKANKNHIQIRIMPRVPNTPISTLNLDKIKTSLDSCIESCTQGEVLQLVKKASKDSQGEWLTQYELQMNQFKNNEEVKPEFGVFQESAHIQAKGTDSKQDDTCLDIAHYWKGKKVRDFISACSSVPHGGIHYTGIQELKIVQEKQPKKGSQKKYGQAKTGSPEKIVKKATGKKFVAKGYIIHSDKREEMYQKLKENVTRKMTWIGKTMPTNPVNLVFHPVLDAKEDVCIAELKVKYYHGLCFMNEDGPEAYHFTIDQRLQSPETERVQLEQWIKGAGGEGLTKQVPDFNEHASTDNGDSKSIPSQGDSREEMETD